MIYIVKISNEIDFDIISKYFKGVVLIEDNEFYSFDPMYSFTIFENFLKQAIVNESEGTDTLISVNDISYLSEYNFQIDENRIKIINICDTYELLLELNIKCFDASVGLNTMENIDIIFKKVIESFVLTTKTYQNVDLYDKVMNFEEAFRIFNHSIRGISLNVGSNALYEITKELSNNNYKVSKSFMKFYEYVFNTLVKEINNYLNN